MHCTLTQGPVLPYQLVPVIWSQLFSVLPMHGFHQTDQVPIFYEYSKLSNFTLYN